MVSITRAPAEWLLRSGFLIDGVAAIVVVEPETELRVEGRHAANWNEQEEEQEKGLGRKEDLLLSRKDAAVDAVVVETVRESESTEIADVDEEAMVGAEGDGTKALRNWRSSEREDSLG